VSSLPPFKHGQGAGDAVGPDRARTLRRFALAAVVLLVLGFGAGALFGRVDPERAARLVVSEYTVVEDGPTDATGPPPAFPVTGPQRDGPVCGRSSEPLAPDRQISTVAAGVVIVQHGSELTDDEEQVLDRLAARDRVVVAPSEILDLDDGGPVVVATSWRRRMPLDRVDAELLDAFVTGHADRAPDLADCP
jgi:hypothetical protein